ncbi:hypothetical protein [Abiotrophia defectiva]|uniref:hypothetical protein n=1 Tax=Abiotrophia defectiva TaxID=46125 RepID=UPI0028D68699|nr:hypothetical protein [Abiotrophia defectiva]
MGTQKVETVFKEENLELVFRPEDSEKAFIAKAFNLFSDYMDIDDVGYDWASNFESGRYVIVVYQRFSVFENGKRMWINKAFQNKVGRFSRYKKQVFAIMLDREIDYKVPGWGRSLWTYTLQDPKNTLQVLTFPSAWVAEGYAKKYSKEGHKVAVLGWYEDYGMY